MDETDVIDIHRCFSPFLFVNQGADPYRLCLAFPEMVLEPGHGGAAVDDILNQKNILSGEFYIRLPEQADLSRGLRLLAVTRYPDEIDLQGEIDSTTEVGGRR